MKKLSPKKIEERRERREKAKRERIILTVSAIPPFILTVVTIILYACRITPSPLTVASEETTPFCVVTLTEAPPRFNSGKTASAS